MYELKFDQVEDVNGGGIVAGIVAGIAIAAAVITVVDFSIGVYEGFTEK